MPKKWSEFLRQASRHHQKVSSGDNFRRRLGIQITEYCPVNCGHCIFSCGTSGKDIDKELLLEIVESSVENSKIESIGITGGEPFSCVNLLVSVLRAAERSSLEVRIASSGCWATSKTTALEKLTSIGGPFTLIVSVDRYHQQSIPPKHIAFAIQAAKELEIPLKIMVTVGDQGLAVELDPVKLMVMEYLKPEDVIISNLLNFGRANRLQLQSVVENEYVACSGMNVPLINVDGELSFCCVPFATGRRPPLLCRGNIAGRLINDLYEQKDQDYWLIQCLRAGGPGLLATLSGYPSLLTSKQGSVCEYCISLLSDDEFMVQATSAASTSHFKEVVSGLLHQRGINDPMIQYLSGD